MTYYSTKQHTGSVMYGALRCLIQSSQGGIILALRVWDKNRKEGRDAKCRQRSSRDAENR
jgi:hypothetical protein